MPTADVDFDETHDPIVTVPLRRWRNVPRTIFHVCSALFWSAAGAFFLHESLTHDTSVANHRLFYALITCVNFSLAFLELFILKTAWKRPFAILNAGVEVLGQTLPWEKIVSCRWNLYSPGTLMVTAHFEKTVAHHSVPVPQSHRGPVEDTLHHFGKWDGAQLPSHSPMTNLLPR